MTNNSLDKGFHVVKLSITTLVLDFVSLELVVVQDFGSLLVFTPYWKRRFEAR